MLDISAQTEFEIIVKKLFEKAATVEDISDLVRLVRYNRNAIPDNVKLEILSIPCVVLKERCVLKESQTEWAKQNGRYFAGNCIMLEDWKEKFESESFNLVDMGSFMEFILKDSVRLNSDFYLRNPEVTLRDDVQMLNEEWYKEEQVVYAKRLKKALTGLGC